MEKPLISFIIPVWNVPKEYLDECIRSIEAVDAEKEIIVIEDKDHRGQSWARNEGIEKAKGEYIQFVDADDYLLPSYTEIVKILKEKRPDMVQFNTRCCRCSGAEYMLKNNLQGSVCYFVFRREIAGNVSFTNGIVHEDEEYVPLLTLKAKTLIGTTTQPYYYRRHENTTMTTRTEEHITKRLNDFLLVQLNLKERCDALNDNIEKRALNRRISQLTMDYLYNIMMLGRRKELRSRILDLKSNGLYPLPLRFYTWKYYLSALLTRIFKG